MKTLKKFIPAFAVLGIVLLIAVSCCDKSDTIPEPQPEPELEQIPINRLTSKLKSEIHGDEYCVNGDIIEFQLDTLALTLNGEIVSCSDITLLLDGHEIGTYSSVPFETGSYKLDGISHGEHTFKLATTLSCEGYADTDVELDTNLSICIFYEKPIVKMKATEQTFSEYNDAGGNMDRGHTTRELSENEEIIITPSYIDEETVSIFILSQIDKEATNFDATIVSQTIEWSDENAAKAETFVISNYDWDSKVPVTCSIVSRIEGVHEGIDVFFIIFEHYKYVSSAW